MSQTIGHHHNSKEVEMTAVGQDKNGTKRKSFRVGAASINLDKLKIRGAVPKVTK